MKRIIVILLVVLVMVCSCSNFVQNNDARNLTGTWVTEDGSVTVIFNNNGTGTFNGDNISYGISADGQLRFRGGHINTYRLFISPDTKRAILDDRIFIKR